jgi:WD40 repeat protein
VYVAAAVLPEGRALAVTGDDQGNVLVWDVRTRRRLHSLHGHRGAVYAVAASVLSDGRALAVTGDDRGVVLVWDMATGCQVLPPITCLPYRVYAAAITDDGIIVGFGPEVAYLRWNTPGDPC